MGKIDYKSIYDNNKFEWHAMTEHPEKYEALLAGHYSDSNHFVYELLQNAEDERATKVVIEYYPDKLIFYHNGDPFDEGDVIGVSSMLMGTKDKTSGQTIGRFGMGFKSVFKYTYQPEIYSDNEAFRIESYLLPVEINDGFSPSMEKGHLNDRMKGKGGFIPFTDSDHITKIIIPFKKKDEDGNLYSVPGKDVLDKLQSLNGEILLFLASIRNLFWIDRSSNKYAMITLKEDELDERLVTCRIEGSGHNDKEEISKYLRFKKRFDHEKMSDAEVSVAYKLNSRGDNINELKDTDMWVYFPTRDNTNLPFLIHGSFETAVSREKLMTPSAFNDALFDKLGDLIAESMITLRDKKLITQMFIRRTLMQAFKDEEENNTIPGLKEKVTNVFLEEAIFPNRLGDYARAKDLRIPVPHEIGTFRDRPLFADSFENVPRFVSINNERESYFMEYFIWLTDDLKVKQFGLIDWAFNLKRIGGRIVDSHGKNFEDLLDFYRFLSHNTEKFYDSGVEYSRGGAYVSTIRRQLPKAWEILRETPIVLNADNKLVPAFTDGQEQLYLSSSSNYKQIVSSSIVKRSVADSCKGVLVDGFQLTEFNNFQFVKEKILRKYASDSDRIIFDNEDDFIPEYIEDMRQLLQLISSVDSESELKEIKELAKDAYIIKIEADGDTFACPGSTSLPLSKEGVDLRDYYASYTLYDEEYDFEIDFVDVDFYRENDISTDSFDKLGVTVTPFEDGIRRQEGHGDGHWTAKGEFCPRADIDYCEDVLEYIENEPDTELAKRKSAALLKLLLLNARKLKGYVSYRKSNPYEQEEKANLLSTISYYSWLFGKDGKVYTISDLSKYELDEEIYGPVLQMKEAYSILGFVEKAADTTADTFAMVDSMPRRDKVILLNQLARSLGKTITDSNTTYDEDETFDANAWASNDFPIHRVKNIDNLVRHVREEFFCADPITYKEVWRSIRVSKSPKNARAYAIGMYTNDDNIKLCQICMNPTDNVEAVELANFGMELPQMNLCLCPNCASKYKQIRDVNKEDFKSKMRHALRSIDSRSEADSYDIKITGDLTVHFTQTHITEIQTLLQLIEEYGLPKTDGKEAFGALGNELQRTSTVRISRRDIFADDEATATTEPEEIVVEGCFITYKKQDGSVYDNTVQPDKYPLHKAFLGKKVGDEVRFNGKKYTITGIL